MDPVTEQNSVLFNGLYMFPLSVINKDKLIWPKVWLMWFSQF